LKEQLLPQESQIDREHVLRKQLTQLFGEEITASFAAVGLTDISIVCSELDLAAPINAGSTGDQTQVREIFREKFNQLPASTLLANISARIDEMYSHNKEDYTTVRPARVALELPRRVLSEYYQDKTISEVLREQTRDYREIETAVPIQRFAVDQQWRLALYQILTDIDAIDIANRLNEQYDTIWQSISRGMNVSSWINIGSESLNVLFHRLNTALAPTGIIKTGILNSLKDKVSQIDPSRSISVSEYLVSSREREQEHRDAEAAKAQAAEEAAITEEAAFVERVKCIVDTIIEEYFDKGGLVTREDVKTIYKLVYNRLNEVTSTIPDEETLAAMIREEVIREVDGLVKNRIIILEREVEKLVARVEGTFPAQLTEEEIAADETRVAVMALIQEARSREINGLTEHVAEYIQSLGARQLNLLQRLIQNPDVQVVRTETGFRILGNPPRGESISPITGSVNPFELPLLVVLEGERKPQQTISVRMIGLVTSHSSTTHGHVNNIELMTHEGWILVDMHDIEKPEGRAEFSLPAVHMVLPGDVISSFREEINRLQHSRDLSGARFAYTFGIGVKKCEVILKEGDRIPINL
jgi:hypothetical protein